MRKLLALLLISIVMGGHAGASEPDRVRDEAVGLEVARPAPDWVLTDLSKQGVVVHVYSPPGTLIPRLTLMSYPAVFLPEGMNSRAAQVERSPGVRRVRLEAAPLAGVPGVRYETLAGDIRTIEHGIRKGDRFLILQVSARDKDWMDGASGRTFQSVFSEALLIPVAPSTVKLRVDGKTPAQVRRLRRTLGTGRVPFAITDHDLQVELRPDEQRLTVTDDFIVEAREDVRQLALTVTAVVVKRVATDDHDLAFRRRDAGTVLVDLDFPLKPGETRRFRYEASGDPYRYAEDQELVSEIAVYGQVAPNSCFSSHVRYYPTDIRNDAAVRIAISVPAGYTAEAGGEFLGVEEAGDRRVFRYSHPERVPRLLPVGFAAGRFERKSGRTPGGLEIDLYYRRDSAEAAAQRLDMALSSGAVLEHLMGRLPSSRVAICQVEPFRKETGVSLPGLILLSGAYFGDAEGVRIRGSNLHDPAALGLLVVADELSHQWNAYATPLPNELAEGVSTFTNLLYLEQEGGREEYEKGVAYVADAYIALAEAEEDVALADPKLYRSRVYRVVAFCKTAAILDLLRRELGDRMFFDAWKKAFSALRGEAVDYEDLERALSTSSERDLRPFFDQWIFQPGHPRLVVRWSRCESGGVEIEVEQTQPGGLFHLTLPVQIVAGGQCRLYVLAVSGRRQEFKLDVDAAAEAVQVDPGRTLPLLRVRVEGP